LFPHRFRRAEEAAEDIVASRCALEDVAPHLRVNASQHGLRHALAALQDAGDSVHSSINYRLAFRAIAYARLISFWASL
jgi:hypothetical protein